MYVQVYSFAESPNLNYVGTPLLIQLDAIFLFYFLFFLRPMMMMMMMHISFLTS